MIACTFPLWGVSYMSNVWFLIHTTYEGKTLIRQFCFSCGEIKSTVESSQLLKIILPYLVRHNKLNNKVLAGEFLSWDFNNPQKFTSWNISSYFADFSFDNFMEINVVLLYQKALYLSLKIAVLEQFVKRHILKNLGSSLAHKEALLQMWQSSLKQ